MKTMKKFTSINYLHTRMTKSFPPTRPECHLWGKSPETLDIVCFWFYNRTRRTRCIVEHVHRVASRTSPNLFSVFCVCNGHRKRKKQTNKKEHKEAESTNKTAAVPVFNTTARTSSKFWFWRSCMIYLSPREFVAVIPRKHPFRICLCTGWNCLEQ
jgi:hypothetical protein